MAMESTQERLKLNPLPPGIELRRSLVRRTLTGDETGHEQVQIMDSNKSEHGNR